MSLTRLTVLKPLDTDVNSLVIAVKLQVREFSALLCHFYLFSSASKSNATCHRVDVFKLARVSLAA